MADKAAAPKAESNRNERRTVIGVVTSDKMQKSCRVEVPRQVPHPRYGKIIRRRTVLIAHDEKNDAKIGDTVECMETRPISKTKSWRLVRVVKRAAGSNLGEVAAS